MTAPSLAPITASVLAALRSQISRVGDLGAPTGGVPYAFLARSDTAWEGSLRTPFQVVRVTYQVQCVALDSAGVDFLEHKARTALDAPPVVAGWRVLRYMVPDGPGGIQRDEDTTPHLFFSTPQWRLWAQPT